MFNFLPISQTVFISSRERQVLAGGAAAPFLGPARPWQPAATGLYHENLIIFRSPDNLERRPRSLRPRLFSLSSPPPPAGNLFHLQFGKKFISGQTLPESQERSNEAPSFPPSLPRPRWPRQIRNEERASERESERSREQRARSRLLRMPNRPYIAAGQLQGHQDIAICSDLLTRNLSTLILALYNDTDLDGCKDLCRCLI